MATLHVAFVKLTNDNAGVPSNVIEQVLLAANVTISGSNAVTAVAPAGANAAIVWPVDAACYVLGGSATPVATAILGVYLGTGQQATFRIHPGWKIASITA